MQRTDERRGLQKNTYLHQDPEPAFASRKFLRFERARVSAWTAETCLLRDDAIFLRILCACPVVTCFIEVLSSSPP